METIYKIALLENFTLFSSGIKSILMQDGKFEIVAEAKDAQELLPQMKDTNASVLIIDILHCENAGIKQLKKIRRTIPNIPILLITSQDYADCFWEHLKLGTKGFIFRDDSKEELIKAIIKLSQGETYFQNGVQKSFKEAVKQLKADKKPIRRKPILTDREISVLKLFCRGFTYKEIGAKLFISPRTVETHKKNILSKLKLRSTVEMVKYAFHNRILL